MKSLKTILTTVAFATVAVSQATIAGMGDLAFVGFNADGTDGFSFAALKSVGIGETIRFTDDEWNGSTWADANEAEWTWTATSALAAGSVISVTEVNNLYSGAPFTSANTGTIAAVSDTLNNPGFSTTSETIYAYIGTRLAPTLIAAISSDSAVNFGGLTGGAAVALSNSSDGAKYTGLRNNQNGHAAYLPQIANVAANWTDIGNGLGDNNFNNSPFVVPEPTSILALGLGAVALLRRKK